MYYIAHLLIEAGLAVLLVCTVFVIIVAIRRALTRPTREPRGVRVIAVVAAAGSAEGLEQAVRELARNAPGVIIADCGLSPDARRLAEIFTREHCNVELCTPSDITGILEDLGWTGENTYA